MSLTEVKKAELFIDISNTPLLHRDQGRIPRYSLNLETYLNEFLPIVMDGTFCIYTCG